MHDLFANLCERSLHKVSWKDLFDRSLHKTSWPLGKISVRGLVARSLVARSLETLHKVSMQGLYARYLRKISARDLYTRSLGRISLTDLYTRPLGKIFVRCLKGTAPQRERHHIRSVGRGSVSAISAMVAAVGLRTCQGLHIASPCQTYIQE